MSYRPFHPRENHSSPTPPAIVAIPTIVQQSQPKLLATALLPVATLTAEKSGRTGSVANCSRTIATGSADKTGTVATIATRADPLPENAEPEALTERAGILMDNGIPQEQADGLALALHLLTPHPTAEAALCWLIDHRNRKDES